MVDVDLGLETYNKISDILIDDYYERLKEFFVQEVEDGHKELTEIMKLGSMLAD